jgi:hypothetical protein
MTIVAAAATTLTVETRSAQHANQIPASLGKVSGEALLTAAPCYIKESDGLVYMCNGTAANEAAELDGWTGKSYAVGEPVTLWGRGVIFEYGTGLTPGADLYIGTTAGRLDTAATAGDGVGVARCISATHIRVTRDCPLGGITDLSVGTGDIAAGAVTIAKAKVFFSAETTGTGSSQNVAHGLGATPTGVLVVPTEHPGTPDTGAFDIAEGTHTSTNVVVTVTLNVKFKVFAWA